MGVLWTCLAIHTQSDTVNSQKTFICSEQISFIPHVFLKIVSSKNQNQNAGTRILPNMGLLVKHQQQYQLSFTIMSKKISLNKILINFVKFFWKKVEYCLPWLMKKLKMLFKMIKFGFFSIYFTYLKLPILKLIFHSHNTQNLQNV